MEMESQIGSEHGMFYWKFETFQKKNLYIFFFDYVSLQATAFIYHT